jgi:hypothetical protein
MKNIQDNILRQLIQKIQEGYYITPIFNNPAKNKKYKNYITQNAEEIAQFVHDDDVLSMGYNKSVIGLLEQKSRILKEQR